MPRLKFPDLPIVSHLAKLATTLESSNTAILCAPPGSGKTTIVPISLIQEPWLNQQKIVMLQPRRMATRAAAARMAELLACAVGEEVGYQVRFERKSSSQTTIEVVTEGILTRRLLRDPELSGVGLVIFDEFHERSLHADLGLALCLDLLSLRDDFRILVMSATIQTEALSRLLNNAPIITLSCQTYPVEIHYLDREPDSRIAQYMTKHIQEIITKHTGDILAFFPGTGEIRSTAAELQNMLPKDIELLPLFGELSKEKQDRAIRPNNSGCRRIILATNIAETSLTIPGVTIVVDSGWCRRIKFHPSSGFTRLETVRISKASSIQRTGRVGRLSKGICYRLWSKTVQDGLQTATPPEIIESDLASLLLDLALWGVSDVSTMAWLDPPPTGAVNQARELLQKLAAIDDTGRITALGLKMAELPLHPRLSHMILHAKSAAERGLACDLAALLTERDPLRKNRLQPTTDIAERIQIINIFRSKGAGAVSQAGGDPVICSQIIRAIDQFRRMVGVAKSLRSQGSIGPLLAAAFPDRVAMLRDGQHNRYLLAGGQGALLPANDPLSSVPWLVVAQLDAGKIDARIYLAATFSKTEIRQHFSEQIQQKTEIYWQPRQSRIMAQQTEKFGAITLSTRPLETPDPEAMRHAMGKGVRNMGLDCLNLSKETRNLQARVALLGQLVPADGWPDLTDATLLITLEHWLGPYLDGISRAGQLQKLDIANILKNKLSWPQLQQLEKEAPTHITVPSGSRIRVRYQVGEPPILAVKVQEMFGLAKTPTICRGRQPLTIHLLSPAHRQLQITSDLENFWQETWPEVRKEMQGRYPKHYWPQDPWSAPATKRSKPRGKK